jgi:hypothetical protein
MSHREYCAITAAMSGGHAWSNTDCDCWALVKGCRCGSCYVRYDVPYRSTGRGRIAKTTRKVRL